MKLKMIISLLVLTSLLTANAQNSSINTSDSIAQQTTGARTAVTYTPTYNDTDEEGETVVSVVIDGDSTDNDADYYSSGSGVDIARTIHSEFVDSFDEAKRGLAIGFLAVLLIFGTPIFIVALALYFNYKNRKNRYRVIEKAIESGQPIPQEFLKTTVNKDTQNKGIKNICLGLGLFIFLWALTNFAIGCIGILVMCNGIGQYIVAQRNSQKPKDSDNDSDK